MFDNEKIYESLYSNYTKEQKQKEIANLYNLYYKRLGEFRKASRLRWLLTFAGIAIIFILIICIFSQPSLKDILNNVWSFVSILLIACMLSAFYIFINISLFGWLIQKVIAEDRRLDDIKKRIYVLEKKLDN